MKKSFIALGVLTFITCAIFSGCNNESATEKVEDAKVEVEEANQDLENANSEYLADMTNYKTATEAKIAANEASIAEFNVRIASEKKEAKAEYMAKIAKLEMKNTDMKKRLADNNSENKENWENFKTEFNRDMDELGVAIKDFTIKNKK